MAQCAVAMFAKKLAGEDDVEAALQRLDRLTQEEARMMDIVNAQTLGVVHRLKRNMAVAIKGAWHLFRRR